MAESYINGYSVTVGSGGIDNSSTSLPVSSAASIASGFRILIGSELMLVTAGGTTTTWTVTRGIEGTTAAAHSATETINVVLTAGALDGIRAAISQVGTYASKPSSGMKSGDRYRCTDSPYEYVYDGSAWQAFVYGYNVTEPVLSNFTQVNVDHTTIDSTHGGLILTVLGQSSSNDVQVLAQAIPGSGAYYVDAAFTILSVGSNGGAGSGLSAGTSTSNAVAYNRVGPEGGTNWYWEAQVMTNTTTFSANNSGTVFQQTSPIQWTRIYDDRSSNCVYYLSGNGYAWIQMRSESRTSTFTPAQGIFAVSPYINTMVIHLLHFSIHA